MMGIVADRDEVLKAEQVSFRDGPTWILKDIELVLKEGESLAVTGGPGSGKTSLGLILAGLVVPATGVLSVRPGLRRMMVSQQDQFMSLSGRRSTYYGQRYEHQGMEDTPTVREYLENIRGNSRSPEGTSLITGIMQQMQIGHLPERKLLELSNGERKRVQLAAALLQQPGLLVLDQPFAGLDTRSRATLAALLEKQPETGMSLVIICDEEQVPPGIHRVLELRSGKICQDAPREAFIPSANKHGPPPAEPDDRLFSVLPAPAEEFKEIVRMNRVNVTIGEKHILKDIDWQVKSGEQWALLGPNGAGKTTLLSLITADHPQGYVNDLVLFDRKRGSGESIWDIKRRIGFVAPELHLYFLRGAGLCNTIPGLNRKASRRYDPLRCMDVLLSGFRDETGFASPPTDVQMEIAEAWLAILNLHHLKKRLYVQSSFGQQRSLLLARALVKAPSLLVLDEPCQGLGHDQTRSFIRMLDTICSRINTTLIYVTHVEEEIPRCVNKMIVLEEGQIKSRLL
ncbi:MAG: ATP-binding cassette domain-containing protein [Mangrovibacterium sp.]|nr:ATP-binding cassette domain-containing protein [Mangrovibacterium sp.]